MIRVEVDHLVVAAATLEQGEDHLQSLLGVRPQRGGRHVAMGTHNSLLRVGPRLYIEVIAIDPDGTAPPRPRWFALDSAALRASLEEAPRLIHWVARSDDIEAARRACRTDPGEIHSMRRDAFEWRITIPADGHLPGAGLLPTLIQWAGERHPADAMPESGVRLVAFAGAHPEPSAIRSALAALGVQDVLKVTFAGEPRLAAMLNGPRGPVSL
ncbi:MAG TPA: VOC family protein [Casimicrobiaceae bacterium]